MDRQLQRFSPMALYQRLSAAVLEQEGICLALEDSFLEKHPHHGHHGHHDVGGGGGRDDGDGWHDEEGTANDDDDYDVDEERENERSEGREMGDGTDRRRGEVGRGKGRRGKEGRIINTRGRGGGRPMTDPSDVDVADFIRSYRKAREVWYTRKEYKDRWDEGRVGGWR